MNPIEIFLERPRVFVLTIIFILISGFFALNSVPRQENPELAQRWSTVQVIYPGASPERIETQVLEPLEAKLREVFEVRRSSKDKYVWPDYGDEKISLEFVNNFIKKYFKLDKKFSFSSPFFPFSESEVFNQISDDDDGF